MKTSEVLKDLEQMCRDKRTTNEIHTAIARYREIAEAEEAAESEQSKSTPPGIQADPDFGAGGVENVI